MSEILKRAEETRKRQEAERKKRLEEQERRATSAPKQSARPKPPTEIPLTPLAFGEALKNFPHNVAGKKTITGILKRNGPSDITIPAYILEVIAWLRDGEPVMVKKPK